MKVGYVVLYVSDPEKSLQFWREKLGMIEKGRNEFGSYSIIKVGFAEQDFTFELVPLKLMESNPEGINLGAPSTAFYVSNLEETRSTLLAKEIECSEITDLGGVKTFGFADNESRWFAVLEG